MSDILPTVPHGYPALTPWAIVDGVAAFMVFLHDVFDAEEVILMRGSDGRVVHAEVRIQDAPLMMFDSRDGWPPTPAFLRVYVPDVDEVVRRSTSDSVLVTPPTTLWIGDRVARIRDRWDNLWWIHTRVAEPSFTQLAAGPPDETAVGNDRVLAETLDDEMRRRRNALRHLERPTQDVGGGETRASLGG